MHVIAGKFKVAPDRREDMIRLAVSLYEPSRAEPGCISYGFYEDQGCKGSFLFFEEWKDQAAIDVHCATPYFAKFMKEGPPMMDGTPSITVYEIRETREL